MPNIIGVGNTSNTPLPFSTLHPTGFQHILFYSQNVCFQPITQDYLVLPHLQNTQRQSPEGGLLVEIKSINQSWTSRDSQLASNDHSDTKSIHIATDSVWVLQETPHIASKSTVNISENKEVCCDSASGKKSLKESSSKQYTPVKLPNQAPAAIANPPPAAYPRTGSSRWPQMEKPRRSSDKRQASKSPLPPQSLHGISSVRSGEPVITTYKETDGIQGDTMRIG
ncbi:hypothetical protein CHARACLAT_010771 [Characodon lateralis]|uniref:Uncharacterized protein n=1 Tax=Characodon lateralis TaxID=208331 RepID=A0ABU7DFR5_9TELE|nr:hypothetical protein [Characodon lateralis]